MDVMKNTVNIRLRKFSFALAVPLGMALSGCDLFGQMTDAEHLAEAKEYQDKGDYLSSVIELKSALQKNPENAEARRLLGETNVKLGKGEDAEKELKRAVDLGVAREAILLSLAQALQLQGKDKEILDSIDAPEGLDAASRAKLLAFRGDAWLAMNKPDKARAEYEEAWKIDDKSALARLGLARLLAANQEIDRAHQLLKEASELSPEEARVWSFQGDLFADQGEAENAEASYSKAMALRKQNQVDRANRALARVSLKNYDAAAEDIRILKTEAPKFFLSHYADGLLLLNQGKYSEAQAALEESLKLNSQYLQAYYFLGVAHLQQNQLSQAEQHLSRVMNAHPGLVHVHKMLALTKFRLNDFQGARSVLLPVLRELPDDSFSQKLMGDIELGLGNKQAGLAYLKRAADLQPDSAVAHLSLGQAMLAQGNKDQGIEALEKAVEVNPSLPEADIALITTHLKHQEYDKAIEITQRMQEKFPRSATPLTLMAGAYIGKGDPAKARELLKQALKLEPLDTQALDNLARLEIAEGKPEEAESLYKNVLAQRPGDLPSLLQLAELEKKKGNAAGMVSFLEQAMEKNPKALAPRVFLGDYYLHSGQPQKTLSLTHEMLELYPQSHTLWAVVGQAEFAIGEPTNAVASFQKLVNLQPQSADAHFLLSRAYAEIKDEKNARSALEKALRFNPNHTAAKYVSVRLLTAEGKQTQADKLFKELKNAHGKSADLFELEAWMALQRKQPRQALTVYEEAGKLFPESNFWPQKVAQVQFEMGDHQASLETLNKWLASHPNDFHIQYVMANSHLLLKQWDEAQTAFSKLHEQAPDNAPVLNNLAWLLRNKDASKALQYAERAHELAPDWAEAADTLGMILLDQGQTERAVTLLRDAASKSPTRLTIAYRLAVALARNGDKTEARKVLSKLLETNEPFAEREAAEKLRKEIGD
jgi:putative PEP-CTERM system TPR-repeat lipoprotein